MARPGSVRIGTSGWVYKHWMGIFYPPKMPGPEQLPFYARHFDTVEVNYSFYRLPPRSVFETWREASPPGFLFAVKGSRYLSHIKKLKDPAQPLQRLMDSATGLQEKLGPILIQLPPAWHADLDRLSVFLDALALYAPQRFTLEVRHRSWLVPDVYRLLERVGVALCLPVSLSVPLDIRLTTSWTYIRVHGGKTGWGMMEDELQEWAERIRAYRREGIDVYVYFNNDPEGWAIRNGERLHELLAQP